MRLWIMKWTFNVSGWMHLKGTILVILTPEIEKVRSHTCALLLRSPFHQSRSPICLNIFGHQCYQFTQKFQWKWKAITIILSIADATVFAINFITNHFPQPKSLPNSCIQTDNSLCKFTYNSAASYTSFMSFNLNSASSYTITLYIQYTIHRERIFDFFFFVVENLHQ